MKSSISDLVTTQPDDLHNFLRSVETLGFQRRIAMPHDDFKTFGDDRRYENTGTVYPVQNWAVTVNAMNEIMARPEVDTSPLWALSYTHKHSDVTVKDLYAVFFVPDPQDPNFGDLYTLGGSLGDAFGLKQNNLQRNWRDEGNAGVNDRISRADALKFISAKRPPFETDHDINWVEIRPANQKIAPITDSDPTFVDGKTKGVRYLEEKGINRHTVDSYIARNMFADHWMKSSIIGSITARFTIK